MAITLSEALGWLGSVLYVVAYLLLSLKKFTADNKLYHFLNILGALGLIVNAFHWGNYPSVAVNFVWLVIALFAIIMAIRKKPDRADSAI
jgi:hypothetical protein